MTRGRVRHVDHRQAAARQPHGGPALDVVHDAQRELAVVVVDLLRARVAVEVDGEEVASVGLRGGDQEGGEGREGWKVTEKGRESIVVTQTPHVLEIGRASCRERVSSPV